MLIKGTAPVFPTEDPEKVKECILNLFPGANVILDNGLIEFTSNSAETLTERIYEQQIRDTALMVISREMIGDRTRFSLNKQVCLVDKVNFTDEGTLGVLEIMIEEGAEELLNSLGPDE